MTGISATLFAAMFVIAGVAGANESVPTYELEVALDVPHAKLVGTARIDVPQGVELSIYRGDLHILFLTTGGRQIAVDNLSIGPATAWPRSTAAN